MKPKTLDAENIMLSSPHRPIAVAGAVQKGITERLAKGDQKAAVLLRLPCSPTQFK